VLLDVPPGLNQRQIMRWRASFDSMWAAAYHPWLTAASIAAGAVPRIPPSAAAAGIVARSEWAHGIPQGPSNELVAGVVDVEDHVDARRHDELHLAGVDVLVKERQGVRLSAARTLSRDPQWRQLSVRRVISMIERALLTQMQWAVFEPNDGYLAATVGHLLENFLDGLYRANAFAGATRDQAFFVNVVGSALDHDLGRFVVEVGVAPAEPLEYIVVRVTRGGDGTLIVEAGRG
jgi:phage tail sheath protein FI